MYMSALSAEALSREITLAEAHSNLALRGLGGEDDASFGCHLSDR